MIISRAVGLSLSLGSFHGFLVTVVYFSCCTVSIESCCLLQPAVFLHRIVSLSHVNGILGVSGSSVQMLVMDWVCAGTGACVFAKYMYVRLL